MLFALLGGLVMIPQTLRAAGDGVTITVGGNLAELDPNQLHYRASENIEIVLSPQSDTYTPTVNHVVGQCVGSQDECGGYQTLPFTIDGSGVATARVNMDLLPKNWMGYYHYVISGDLSLFDSQGDDYGPAYFRHDFFLSKNPVVGLYNEAGDGLVRICASQAYWGNAMMAFRPLVRESLAPRSAVFKFEPAENSTDARGCAYFHVAPVSTTAARSARAPGAVLGDTPHFSGPVTVNVGGQPGGTFTHNMEFARITCLRGLVLREDGFGNKKTAQMDDTLYPGDLVILGGEQNDIRPMVCIDFYDGNRTVVNSLAQEAADITIQIGRSGADGIFQRDCTLDLQRLQLNISTNYREYLQVAVYNLYASAIVAPLNWGWKGATAAKKLVEMGFKKAFGDKNLRQSATAGGWSRPNTGLDSRPVLGNTGYTVPSLGVTFMADGSFKLANWLGTMEMKALDVGTNQTITGLLPLGTTSAGNAEYSAFSPPAPIPTTKRPDLISILPADGSVPATPPLIEISYPWNIYDPALQPTLDVRLNGVLITPYLTRAYGTDTTAVWQAPYSWPFTAGANEIDAFIQTRSGAIYSGKSTFTLDPVPQPPRHLKAYRGKTQTMLRWQAGAPSGSVKFQVYRADSKEGAAVLVTPVPLGDPVYITDQPGWYSVAAIDQNGKISLRTEPVPGALDPAAAAQTPSAPQGFSAAGGEQGVTLDFYPDSFVPAYRLERAALSAGPFAPLALLTGSPYIDAQVTVGNTYWYRLIALGTDLTESNPAGPLAALVSDLPPPIPTGFNCRFMPQGMRLLWDPSTVPDLAGYNLYRSEPGGPFVKRNSTPLTDNQVVDFVSLNNVFAWQVTAVDQQGQESPPTGILEFSTWIHPTAGSASYIFLPVVLR